MRASKLPVLGVRAANLNQTLRRRVVHTKGSEESYRDNNNHNSQAPYNGIVPYAMITHLLAQQSDDTTEDSDTDSRLLAYHCLGRPGRLADIQGLDRLLEFAEWAYYESHEVLQEKLRHVGFTLVQHDTSKGSLGHYVALSKTNKVAILAIRGTTLSRVEDLVTNVQCRPARVHQWEDGTMVTCHSGIWLAARQLADTLGDLVHDTLVPRGYQIQLVGHSLGGAVAAVLGWMLHTKRLSCGRAGDEKETQWHVHAFACPPILDLVTAQSMASYVTAIVNNSDIVPRASLSNLSTTLGTLQDIYQTMIQNGMGEASIESSIVLLNQLARGGVPLEHEEHQKRFMVDQGMLEQQSPNRLFVPGRVIFLYNHSLKEQPAADNRIVHYNEDMGFVVAPNGNLPALAFMTLLDEGMIANHSIASYRSSIQDVLRRCQTQRIPQSFDEEK